MTENTKTNLTDQSKLDHNTFRAYFSRSIYEITQILVENNIPFKVCESNEGWWINVTWPNGIIAPLSFQEADQLPNYENLRGDKKCLPNNQKN